MKSIILLSLGGSLVAPDGIDAGYLKKFVVFIRRNFRQFRFIIVVGGGYTARAYVASARKLKVAKNADLDWIGIFASRLNAQLLRSLFGVSAHSQIAVDPGRATTFKRSVLVAAGYRPGWSTDYVAVLLAKKFKLRRIINLTNTSHVYTADPKKDNGARPVREIRWKQFRTLTGSRWIPGLHLPFDPIASKLAQKLGREVIVAAGKDLKNLQKILQQKKFKGTRIY